MSEAFRLSVRNAARENLPGLRVIDGAIVFYVLLALYGGLVPFDLTADWGTVSRHFQRAVNCWPLGNGSVGRRDLLANVALCVPFGFLVSGRCLIGRRSARALPLLAAVALSAALSLGIEGLQLFSETRTAAASDLIANTAGGLMGGAAAVAFCPVVWPRLVDRLSALWVNRPVAPVGMVMATFLIADALDPLYPVLKLSQLLRNLRASHFDLASALQVHPWHHWLVCRVGLYAVFAAVLGAGGLGSGRRWKWARSAGAALCFAAFMEACKPLVVHRTANVANVLTAACGAVVGAALGSALSGRLSSRVKLAIAILLLASYIGYHEWEPFVFTSDVEAMAAKVPSGQDWIPLYQFAAGARRTWEIRLLVRIVAVTAALTFAACLYRGWPACGSRKAVAAKGMVLGCCTGVVLELGQLFIVGRHPSPSHVLFFIVGGAAGSWVFCLIRARSGAF